MLLLQCANDDSARPETPRPVSASGSTGPQGCMAASKTPLRHSVRVSGAGSHPEGIRLVRTSLRTRGSPKKPGGFDPLSFRLGRRWRSSISTAQRGRHVTKTFDPAMCDIGASRQATSTEPTGEGADRVGRAMKNRRRQHTVERPGGCATLETWLNGKSTALLTRWAKNPCRFDPCRLRLGEHGPHGV